MLEKTGLNNKVDHHEVIERDVHQAIDTLFVSVESSLQDFEKALHSVANAFNREGKPTLVGTISAYWHITMALMRCAKNQKKNSSTSHVVRRDGSIIIFISEDKSKEKENGDCDPNL